MIILQLILHSEAHIYDFHIFITSLTTIITLANISYFALPATLMIIYLFCAWFLCLLTYLWTLWWNTLLELRRFFCSWLNSPPTLATAICEINSWHRVLHIIAQHKLIVEISKTQGDSQGSAPVLFANLVRILQPRRAGHEFDVSCSVIFFIKFHFCCELAHVNVWVAFSKRRKSFFLCCSGRFFSLWCPRRDFAQKATSRGGTTRANYQGNYLQLIYTVSMPEKISICLNRGREESVGNDDVTIVCARKYEMVRMK